MALAHELFRRALMEGFYRDDGLSAFNYRMVYEEMVSWMEQFQAHVNRLAASGPEDLDNEYLQYTCTMWIPGGEQPENPDPKVSVVTAEAFPYLDMEMYWDSDEHLSFRVHMKDNQQLKYLNKGSLHTKSCYKAIPEGVYNRLGKLTTMNESNQMTLVSNLYPTHFQKLRQAGLVRGNSPTLQQIHQLAASKKTAQHKTNRDEKQKQRDRKTYFCVGFSTAWTTPIHAIIKDLKNKFGLPWIRTSMSYHRFPNLREIFQQDLTRKLNVDVISRDYMNLPCNCQGAQTDRCPYNDVCRDVLVVYQAKCKMTGKVYVGSTHQHLKKRMQRHHSDTIKMHKGQSTGSTAFARHFATQLQNFPVLTPTIIWNFIDYSVLWRGNPLSSVKTFATLLKEGLSCRDPLAYSYIAALKLSNCLYLVMVFPLFEE